MGGPVRETSRRAHREILPALPGARAAVYFALKCHGAGTAREVCNTASLDGGWKRFSELQRLGMIEEVDRRRCKVTGRMAIVWAVRKPPRRGDEH